MRSPGFTVMYGSLAVVGLMVASSLVSIAHCESFPGHLGEDPGGPGEGELRRHLRPGILENIAARVAERHVEGARRRRLGGGNDDEISPRADIARAHLRNPRDARLPQIGPGHTRRGAP